MTRGRIGVFGLVCALLSASPVTAQEATPAQDAPTDNDGVDGTSPTEPAATPAQDAPTEEKKRWWEQAKARDAAAAEAREQRAAEALGTQRKHHEQMRALFYGAQPMPVRVLYDPVWCNEYERTGGPIAGTVVGVTFIGAGAGVAAASNGDKALLGTGIAMAVAGLASTIASGVVLAKRKKARYRQALAGCPVIAK